MLGTFNGSEYNRLNDTLKVSKVKGGDIICSSPGPQRKMGWLFYSFFNCIFKPLISIMLIMNLDLQKYGRLLLKKL